MDSKLAAARLDFMELLAGDGAVFSRLLQGTKVEQGERDRSPGSHVRLRAPYLCTSYRREPWLLLSNLWYMTTVATKSYDMRVKIATALHASGESELHAWDSSASKLVDLHCEAIASLRKPLF